MNTIKIAIRGPITDEGMGTGYIIDLFLAMDGKNPEQRSLFSKTDDLNTVFDAAISCLKNDLK